MKIAPLSIVMSLLVVGSAGAVDRLVSGFPELPKDAQEVAKRSVACQHFWGEVTGKGDERDKEVAAQLRELKCNQVARDLEAIRTKYKESPKVLAILKEAA